MLLSAVVFLYCLELVGVFVPKTIWTFDRDDRFLKFLSSLLEAEIIVLLLLQSLELILAHRVGE